MTEEKIPDKLSKAAVNLPWPLISIDFEASALGMKSYPIEVGVAIWPTFDSQIEVWSTLITPIAEWLEGGTWSVEAEAIHSIREAELTEGMEPAAVMIILNELVSSHTCWCDGDWQDDFWLRSLANAAANPPSFKLGDWDALSGGLQPDGYRRMVLWMDRTPSIHRAGPDAERLLRAIAVGLGAEAGESITNHVLSGAAFRTFGNIAEEWNLSESERVSILGRRITGETRSLNHDDLIRISCLIGIYKDINMLLPIRERANAWMRAENAAFNGTSALNVILAGGLLGLLRVRRYLAAQMN